MDIAAIKPYNAIRVLYTPEPVDFLFIVAFSFLCSIAFEYKGVRVEGFYLLILLANEELWKIAYKSYCILSR